MVKEFSDAYAIRLILAAAMKDVSKRQNAAGADGVGEVEKARKQERQKHVRRQRRREGKPFDRDCTERCIAVTVTL